MARGSPTPCLLLSPGISCEALEQAGWSDLPPRGHWEAPDRLGQRRATGDRESLGPPLPSPGLLPFLCRLLCVPGTVAADGHSMPPLEGAGGKCGRTPHLGSGPDLPCALLGEMVCARARPGKGSQPLWQELPLVGSATEGRHSFWEKVNPHPGCWLPRGRLPRISPVKRPARRLSA